MDVNHQGDGRTDLAEELADVILRDRESQIGDDEFLSVESGDLWGLLLLLVLLGVGCLAGTASLAALGAAHRTTAAASLGACRVACLGFRNLFMSIDSE
jgi:hypothetical protein